MLLCCLRRNVDWFLVISTSSSFPIKNKRRRLSATSVNNLPRFVAAECIALGSRTVHSTRWSHVLVENGLPHQHSTPPLGGPHRNIAMAFGVEKLEWVGYPMVKKNHWRYIIHFDRIHERDGRTDRRIDRQTDWQRMTAIMRRRSSPVAETAHVTITSDIYTSRSPNRNPKYLWLV